MVPASQFLPPQNDFLAWTMVGFCSLCFPITATIRKTVSSDELSTLGVRKKPLPHWENILGHTYQSVHLGPSESLKFTQAHVQRSTAKEVRFPPLCSPVLVRPKQQACQHSRGQQPLSLSFRGEGCCPPAAEQGDENKQCVCEQNPERSCSRVPRPWSNPKFIKFCAFDVVEKKLHMKLQDSKCITPHSW